MTEKHDDTTTKDDLQNMVEAGWTLQQDCCSSGTVHEFIVGELFEGAVRGMRAVNVRRGKEVVKARLMTVLAENEIVTIWESAALSGLFDSAKVGDDICIEYLGEVEMPAPKSPMKDYRVWVRPHDEG